MFRRIVPFLACLLVLLAIGCSRTRYRMAADRDTYRVIGEKIGCQTHPFPANYQVQPDRRSRFFDLTNPDCPSLPVPRPVLYGYQLPELYSGRPMAKPLASYGSAIPDNKQTDVPTKETISPLEIEASNKNDETLQSEALPSEQSPANPSEVIAPPNNSENSKPPPGAIPNPQDLPQVSPAEPLVLPVGFFIQPAASPGNLGPVLESTPTVERLKSTDSPSAPTNALNTKPASSYASRFIDARRVVIPPSAWEALPKVCLNRMLEFESMQREYVATYPNTKIEDEATKNIRRLNLANLMELAMINSREYQTRKEILFRTALAVTRQRYQFDLNPTPFGNGTAANYRHLRNEGKTVNRLAIPSGVGVRQTLATGGEFLARFANSVVLTFNGPSGFAADIGSEMIFDFQQTIFQRDVRFENLTQSERDVVYAVRDYLRFRKQLFREVANQYYSLLLNYRTIEINSQDYFTNLRGFLQSQAEYRTAEKIPRIQVDQFEQNVLRTRSNIVTNCFALEAALDALKFRLGLPIETAIHLDLTELASISLRDELSVASQMIQRTQNELTTACQSPISDPTTLANVAEVLTDRMLNIISIQQRMESDQSPGIGFPASQVEVADSPRGNGTALEKALERLNGQRQLLQILGARLQVDLLRSEFENQLDADLPVPPLRILIRGIEFAAAEMQVIDLALEGSQQQKKSEQHEKLKAERVRLIERLEDLSRFLERISARATLDAASGDNDEFNQIPDRMKQTIDLVKQVEKLGKLATKDILPEDGKSLEAKVEAAVNQSIELSHELLKKGPFGWKDIEIDHDEALLTGLVQRLDLMNQRGDLADAWRQIKLAGDDLRSIVDLQATHILRTKRGDNDPLNFTFDDSETRLSVALDTPLNRRLQRNNFRAALINYNLGLRNLIAAEDSIKLDIREDLRQLALDRSQYEIGVASAALAFERVISTRIRFQFAVQNVAARDFLESQQAYTNALNTIARQHVNYISDRLELFFDLEAFDVDQFGYWPGVHQDDGPNMNVDFPTTNPRPYDCLPPRVWYSPTIRQMEGIPPGESTIVQP